MNYVALIRGIGPGNPNMSNDNLCSVIKSLGMKNVRAVISSGNVIFSTNETNEVELESTITESLQMELGIPGQTIVRSQVELERLLEKNTFGGLVHSQKSYLTITFFDRDEPHPDFLSMQNDKVLRQTNRELCMMTDATKSGGAKTMQALEKAYGKSITTRTCKTVERIVKKMSELDG